MEQVQDYDNGVSSCIINCMGKGVLMYNQKFLCIFLMLLLGYACASQSQILHTFKCCSVSGACMN